MSRRFRNQICVYCLSRPSIPQGDHVFARRFFPVSQRDNLPKVPGCNECNNEKSRLEQYLMTVMPFGAMHADALSNLENDVPGRLAENQRLHRELREGMTQEASGATTLPFDSERLCGLMSFIVKALLWHHWRVTLPTEFNIQTILITREVEPLFAPFFQMNAAQTVTGNIGNGAFRYEGKQGTDYPELSVWALSLMGGLTTTGDPASPSSQARIVFALTGQRDFISRLDAILS